MEGEREFFQRRALEERSAAMGSADLRVRRIHLEMAERYDQLIRERELRLGFSIFPDPGVEAAEVLRSKS